MTAALEGGEWSAARPDRTLPPRRTRCPLYRRLGGWAPGPVWTGEESRPHRDSIPDRPARSQSLYRLSYRAHVIITIKLTYNSRPIIQIKFSPAFCKLNTRALSHNMFSSSFRNCPSARCVLAASLMAFS